MREPTERQLAIFQFLKQYINQKGYAPSVREIACEFGMKSVSGAFKHLSALEKKGYIRRTKDKARAIEIAGHAKLNSMEIPFVGTVAAGLPLLATENIEGAISTPLPLIKGKGNFFLQIQGDSMIEAGIHNGDYVLVAPQSTVRNGEIVVALIEDEATVKKFYKRQNIIELIPANSSMQPIRVGADQRISILGKVTAVIRVIEQGASLF